MLCQASWGSPQQHNMQTAGPPKLQPPPAHHEGLRPPPVHLPLAATYGSHLFLPPFLQDAQQHGCTSTQGTSWTTGLRAKSMLQSTSKEAAAGGSVHAEAARPEWGSKRRPGGSACCALGSAALPAVEYKCGRAAGRWGAASSAPRKTPAGGLVGDGWVGAERARCATHHPPAPTLSCTAGAAPSS